MIRSDIIEKYSDIIEHQGMVNPPQDCLDIIDKCFADIKKADPNVKVLQVKTKFCEVRIYVDGNEEALNIARKAEQDCDDRFYG